MNESDTNTYHNQKTERHKIVKDTLNVLIIDNNDVVCKYVEKTIHRYCSPCLFSIVDDAYKGLKLILDEKKQFDLILLDTTLSDNQTENFIDCIRQVENETPIILMALSELQLPYEKIVSIGADAIIYKPIRVSDLISVIKNILVIDMDSRGSANKSKFFKIPIE